MEFEQTMRFSRLLFVCSWMAALLVLGLSRAAQNPPDSSPSPAVPAKPEQTRITIEVTGGDKGLPVENASVYLKYVEEHAIKKNKKIELNVKTSREGLAHVPDAPLGRALVQIVAEGW